MSEDQPHEPAPLSPYMLRHQAAERKRAGGRVPCPFSPASQAAIDWLLGTSDGEDDEQTLHRHLLRDLTSPA